MTTVPTEIRTRVNDRITELNKIAEARFLKTFPFPNVRYDLKGSNAGVAIVHKWEINLNAPLLLQNVDHFIHVTVGHEFAHLIAEKVYPHTATGLIPSRHSIWGFRRTKREMHGPKWQSVMILFGLKPDRCHSYDISTVRRRKSTSRIFCCKTCGKEFTLGLKSIQKWQRNPSCIWGRCHGRTYGTLIPKEQFLPGVTIEPKAVSTLMAPPVNLPMINGTIVSKMTKCRAIYRSDPYAARSTIIRRFINEAGCTKAGANTYFYQLQKSY